MEAIRETCEERGRRGTRDLWPLSSRLSEVKRVGTLMLKARALNCCSSNLVCFSLAWTLQDAEQGVGHSGVSEICVRAG